MNKFVRLQALCAAVGIALASAAVSAGPDLTRVMITIKPGSASQVENAARGVGGNVHHRFDNLGVIAVSIPTVALNGFLNNPNIVSYEPDAERYPMGQTVPYGIPMVQAPTLVATGADGTGIKVCIIDSGIKADHEDFAGISMTGTASSGQSWNTDTCGHGTHVAGTIAAVNNTTGVVGVSPGKVSLHIVKVFDGASCAWSYASTLIAAAQSCQAAGAKVINMSLGGGTSSRTEQQAFDQLNAAGILSIAAAGNDGNNRMSYPASYSSVMSVAAVDSAKAKASFSQYNSQVEIAAPGVGVLSTYPIASATATVGGTGYAVESMTNSPQLVRSGAVVDGGICDSIGAWSGKVVLCQRGVIAFEDKVLNAQRGGAVAAIVYNNAAGSFGGTLASPTQTTIPSVSMSMEDGLDIQATKLGLTAAVSTIANTNANAYASLDGTSMATPHVAGVAAIVWSSKPTATNTEVRNALTSTAEDLGAAGRDVNFGFGLVRAFDAASALAASGGGGGGTATDPSNLSGTKTVKGTSYTYSLRWSGGASTVDIYRGSTRVRAAITNTGSYSETVKNVSTAIYKVCNAGSSTACASVTL